jgi:hypothetical protein
MKQRILYAVLALAYLIPIWAVEYLPTTDGPAHTYNAWVLRQIDNRAEYPLFDRYYVIDARPLPNWLGHAVMTGLMRAVPPLTAEKLLASGYVLLFLAGAWFLAGAVDPERGWLAFLALPMVFNRFFQMGFYNFCLGLGLFLVTLGFWWRRRHDRGLGYALALNGLLFLCWFAHLVAHFLTIAAIGTLWLLTARGWRERVRGLAVLAPQMILPLWFLSQGKGDLEWLPHAAGAVWLYLLRLQMVVSHGFWIGPFLGLAFLAVLILTLRARWLGDRARLWRQEDSFLLLSALFVVLYLAAPDNAVGGSLLKQRLSLFPWLVLLPWLAPDLGRRGRAVAVGALSLLAVAHVTLLVQGYRILDREMREYLSGTAAIAPDSRVLPLLFDRRVAIAGLGSIDHAFSYAALDKGLLDWNNYEAASGLFPVRFRPGVRQPDIAEALLGKLDLAAFRDEIDYVYCWKMSPGSESARRIERHYDLLDERGASRLYARKGWRVPGPPGGTRED